MIGRRVVACRIVGLCVATFWLLSLPLYAGPILDPEFGPYKLIRPVGAVVRLGDSESPAPPVLYDGTGLSHPNPLRASHGPDLDTVWREPIGEDSLPVSVEFDLGGEFRALGRHPEGRDWRIAVEHPVTGHPTDMVLHLPAGMAVATSGLGVQSYGRNGQLWGHIMDPATAHPVAGRLRSVTVLAKDAMTADGWATALFAAGDDGGPALARVQDISAIFLFEDGQTLRRTDTGGIREVLG